MSLSSKSDFANRQAVLATMHQKEAVIAPLLKQELGIEVVVPPNFNSDRFGTFTREIDRPANQVETAKLKALAVLELTDATMAIASEGSFTPHPAMPFLPCDREVVLMIDRHHDLEVVGEVISMETNFRHAAITTLEEALIFAQNVGFPAHGLIAMPDADCHNATLIYKGITTEPELIDRVTQLLKTFGNAHLETDMRAMHNPTRMNVIRQATCDLIRKLKQACPQCHTPGFDVVERRHGLPCALCFHPTDQILALIYRCQRCRFEQPVMFPNGVETANPAGCEFCNP
ncbi:MAG: hypothetical protein IGS48_18635 [Oscillatoriales cyanobacterium C42_A2020_001]|nr:hypothetical protein [Leptolyngbyaceae cyanobacterium C42_A2020_001]